MDGKTNAMRILEEAGVLLSCREIDGAFEDSSAAADSLGIPRDMLFKTLVTRGRSGAYYVFMVPAEESLDLKKGAAVFGEKFIGLIPQKELLKLTGYIHGGCSPVGMKKAFPTVIDETAILFERIFFSAGRVGCLAEVLCGRFIDGFGVRVADVAEFDS
ncbi:MAG: aminoacyl-tRNA deacylase [Clostridia bacterium]|nr:aminoacyl-tRNA deacylase [Clostridia bacterium]